MPTDHFSPETLEAFARRELPAEAMREVDRHLAGCDACRAIAPGATGGQGLIAAVHFERARHLSFEELELLVDAGENGIDALAREHVAACASCQRELADLKSFETLLAPETGSTASVVTRPVGAAPPRTVRGGWFANPFTWGATAAALIALLVVWPTLRPTEHATIAPSGFVVRLGGTASPQSGQGSNALLSGESAPLPAAVIQALSGARQRAAETGEAQTIDISLRGREFAALTDELRAIGAVEDEPDVEVDPDSEMRVSVTLLPKEPKE